MPDTADAIGASITQPAGDHPGVTHCTVIVSPVVTEHAAAFLQD